jgi:tetratricopeptide (TPR) repeat protein
MSNNEHFSARTRPAFTPFWRRFPRFFLYPMQLGSLLRIGAYSAVGSIALFTLPLLALPLSLIVWVVFLKYAFLVMERTADGRFDEPDGVNGGEGDTSQVFRQFGLIIILTLLFVMLAFAMGTAGAIVGWIVLNLALPAGTMIIAVSRSLPEALNPARVFFYIGSIGSPYLALCFVLTSLMGSGNWLKGFLLEHMNPWLALPMTNFVEFYFVLICYHMMGYALYQYHDKLGLEAAVDFDQAEARLSLGKAADPVMTKLSTLVADGRQDEALDLLREELRRRWEDNALHERYQKLLLASGKTSTALQHAREFIAKLANEKRMFQALDLCEQCLKSDPEFMLQDSTQIHELASAASVAKRPKLALDLMRRFDKRYPNHPLIPSIYLLSARVLGEHYQRRDEAVKILRGLQLKFPSHAAAEDARRYMDMLNRQMAID